MNNTIKTFLLLSLLSVLIIFIGGAVGGRSGILTAFIFSLAMNGGAYFFSDKLALSMNGARAVTREQAPELYAMVEDLTHKANIPVPKIYITPESQANAFATGRDVNHAAVAVTEGLMRTLRPDEVKAVIAHELGHIKHRDILISSIAAVLASTVGFLANMAMFGGFNRNDEEDSPLGGFAPIVIAIAAPLAATLIQFAVSRSREFEADAYAKQLMGTGQYLANALRGIHASVGHDAPAHVNPGYSSLYIANPFGGAGRTFANLFSTHPPVEERIKKLLQG